MLSWASTVATLGMSPGVEDELLGMPLEMAVALQDLVCLGPQFQVTDIKRNIARVTAGDVPKSIVETLLAPVLLALVLLASVASTSVLSVSLAWLLQPLVGGVAGDFRRAVTLTTASSPLEERPSNRAGAE